MADLSVIGSGFSGLSAALTLAKHGHSVSVFEKNSSPGGRARALHIDGFTFDMGPSWYWMPDVIEEFFTASGSSSQEHYDLVRLDPAFRMIFPGGETFDVPGTFEGLVSRFDEVERGAGAKLRRFMAEGKVKYDIGVRSLAYKSGRSLLEFCTWDLLRNLHRLDLFRRFDRYVGSFFSDYRLRRIMEFPILFLGTLPRNTPALYSFMNYGGLVGGTWYPMGGMNRIVDGLVALATRHDISLHLDSPVREIVVHRGSVASLRLDAREVPTRGVIASADYHHVEQHLLSPEYRSYDERYWNGRTMAPSCLIVYLGLRSKIPNLLHHTLFFDVDFDRHADALYGDPRWPHDPLFYVCAPSKTDPSVAPPECENLFILVPIAAGLEDPQETRDRVVERVLERLERYTGAPLRQDIAVKRVYSVSDFISDYHAFRGNGYGLANTLRQTAMGKPAIRSRKVQRLVYAGQLTVPGPGVPPSLISGQIAASELLKQHV